MRIWLSVEVDDDLRAAIGNRLGTDRATLSTIRSSLGGALDGWLEDVMYEWREGSARPREDDDNEYRPDFDTGEPH
jgi:hypothetical protein